MAPGDGTVTVSRRELLAEIKTSGSAPTATGVIPLVPSKDALAWLHNLSQAFELIIWHSALVQYVPMVGTTENGSLIHGVDWTNVVSADGLTRAKVSALTPVLDSPIWQANQLRLPTAQLQSRKFYALASDDKFDSRPGQIVYVASSKTAGTVGELWLTYQVTLKGTRPV